MKLRLRISGFTLIELMIAMAIGLIVIGSAIALMVSVMRANSENRQSTRLTQELRALTDIVARELRRARYNEDTLTFVGEARDDDNGDGVVDSDDWQPTNPFDAFTVVAASGNDDADAATVDGSCVQFSYDGAENGAFRTIARTLNNGVGAIALGRAAAASPACANVDVQLSSPELNVTRFSINYRGSNVVAGRTDTDWARITVEGRLTNAPDITRRITETVRIRSALFPTLAPLPPATP